MEFSIISFEDKIYSLVEWNEAFLSRDGERLSKAWEIFSHLSKIERDWAVQIASSAYVDDARSIDRIKSFTDWCTNR